MVDPDIVIFHGGESSMTRFADRLSDRYAVEVVSVSEDDGVPETPLPTEGVVVDWTLPRAVRSAIVERATSATPSRFVLAVTDGVPRSDPVGDGADTYVLSSAPRERILRNVEVLGLQVAYQNEMSAFLSAAIDESEGADDRTAMYRGTDDPGDTDDESTDTADRKATLDEKLRDLSDEVSYATLFRRLLRDDR